MSCFAIISIVGIFAIACLLWTASGQPVDSWIFVSQGQTSRTAAASALSPSEPLEGSRRLLSENELAELRAYITPIGPKIIVTAILWNLAVIAPVVGSVLLGPKEAPLTYGKGLGVAIAIVVAAIGYDRSFAVRRRLQRDLDQRIVVTGRKNGVLVEILPNSHRFWTVGGVPAIWRRSGRPLFPRASDPV